MDHGHYPFSALPTRPPLAWPAGARVAVVVSVAVEGSATVPDPGQWLPPGHPSWLDVSAASLADYGSRVGFFRLARILDDFGVPATVPVSDVVVRRSRRVVEEAVRRGWELVGHGPRADHLLTSELTAAQELQLLRASREAIAAVAGAAPSGWTGPRQSESMRTPQLAAEAGYEYIIDWGNDDQPYTMNAASPGGPLVSVPASVDLCDLLVMGDFAQTPWDFGAALTEHLEVLLADGSGGRCMVLTLHAQHSGQAFRAKYIRGFLQRARNLDGVWFATGRDVVAAFRSASSVATAGR
jgi:peptidoglycan/xylan/chitin deacetylase (PgdA/CDA1 family)